MINNDLFSGIISLSVAIIVKDEEESLPGCLESIRSVASQIVVVDTGSSDKTTDIALKYGADVYEFEWVNDFSAARNKSLKYCKCEWILYLDADERLTEESTDMLIEYLVQADEKVGAYTVKIISNYIDDDGKIAEHKGSYPRLFRNLGYPRISFIGKVHEQISPSIFENGYDIEDSKLTIIHEGYMGTREEMNQKVAKNLNILAEHVRQEPQNAYAWYQLGHTLFQMQILDKALECLDFALICGNLSPFLSANTAFSIAKIHIKNKNFGKALEYCERSLQFIPDFSAAISVKNKLLEVTSDK